MQLIQEQTNPNFLAAWKYVDHNYAYLIRESYLTSVSLLAPEHHQPGADGLHIWDSFSNSARITVRNGKYPTARFVDILVHELTHLVQCSSGRVKSMTRDQMEAEAYPAGENARRLFELQDISSLANAMQASVVAARQQRWARF